MSYCHINSYNEKYQNYKKLKDMRMKSNFGNKNDKIFFKKTNINDEKCNFIKIIQILTNINNIYMLLAHYLFNK